MLRDSYRINKTNEELNFFNLNPCCSVHLKSTKIAPSPENRKIMTNGIIKGDNTIKANDVK